MVFKYLSIVGVLFLFSSASFALEDREINRRFDILMEHDKTITERQNALSSEL